MTAALDIERFRKVQALARSGATAGERAAASSRLDAMAKAAGMTVLRASKAAAKAKAGNAWAKTEAKARKASAPKAAPSSASEAADLFNAFFNSPEMRAAREEQDRKRAIRRTEVLREYGSEDAVFADTAEEIALRAAVAHLIVMRRWDDGRDYVSSLAGWNGYGLDKMPAEVRAAIEGAIPMPASVAETWAEYLRWDKLSRDRCACEPAFEDWYWVQARNLLLEEALNAQPAASAADMIARLDWMQHLHDTHSSWAREQEPIRLATLRADVARLAEGYSQSAHPSSVYNGQAQGSADCAHPSSERHLHDTGALGQDRVVPSADVQSGHPSASGRRALVMSMLDSQETSGLSDREIARRAGVSPTTVGKLRRTAR